MNLNSIENLGIERVLKRGTGEIIYRDNDAILVRDKVSKALLFACDDTKKGLSILDNYINEDCNLLMVSDYDLGKSAFGRYGFEDMIECYQVAYYGEKPKEDTTISFRVADISDIGMLLENYDMISPDELREVVERGNIILGYHDNTLIGFIGEHLEGSMGILYVFPEYRKKGFATALQKHMIAVTMEKSFIPFGQVEKDNGASLRLQKKLGMVCSENLITWMWR
ncbi:MAG: GNAT family N-acetyltransferase [Lachnospiraceae bacterium]|nr:GNAT family N-acetyltransferase [Lachnospiraceae bacterium]